jgi:hypothetical protein
MPESTNIIDNIDEMIRLHHETIETLSKMKKALLLADLLGVSPKALKEPVRFVVRKGDNTRMPWVGAVLSVRIGAAPYEDFKLTDVDRRLWPEDMQQAWGRWQKVQARKKKNPTK